MKTDPNSLFNYRSLQRVETVVFVDVAESKTVLELAAS